MPGALGWDLVGSLAPRDFLRGRLVWGGGPTRAPRGGGSTEPRALQPGLTVLKLQAPVDQSDDSRGGLGPMTPTTLLLSCPDGVLHREVDEDEKGHLALTRIAIRHRSTAFVYGLVSDPPTTLRLYTEVTCNREARSGD